MSGTISAVSASAPVLDGATAEEDQFLGSGQKVDVDAVLRRAKIALNHTDADDITPLVRNHSAAQQVYGKRDEESALHMQEAPPDGHGDDAARSTTQHAASTRSSSSNAPLVTAPGGDALDGSLEAPALPGVPRKLPTRRVSLHRVWPSKNRFFCSGFWMTGSPLHSCSTAGCIHDCIDTVPRCARVCEPTADLIESSEVLNTPPCTRVSPVNLCTWGCIICPSALYFRMALPYLWVKVHWMVPLFAVFFFAMTVCCLLAACLSDPGVIPRREVILATGTAKWLEEELGYNVLGAPVNAEDSCGTGRFATVPHDLRRRGYKWCSTCNIVRPPRASHCPDCDNCVLRFDHHCPFINNCVGQRNYLFFVSFVTSVCCLAISVIPLLLWTLSRATEDEEENDVASSQLDMSAVMLGALITIGLAASCGGLMVLLLWGYHMFLICTGMTTKEHWKGTASKRLPGLGEELTVCARRGPRLFNPRAMVDAVAAAYDPTFGIRRKWQLRAGVDEESLHAGP